MSNTQQSENLPAVQSGGRAMAKPSDLYRMHQEEAKKLKAGRIFLKFSKGDWLIGKDAETFPNNEFYFVPGMDMFEKGWQCWKGGRPVDEQFTAYGGVDILEKDLADHAPYPGKNDGWAEALKFPLIIVPHGENTAAWMNVEFATSSEGGKNAIYSLSKQFSEKIKLGEVTDERPYILVRAGSDSYDHKDWGKVYYPVVEVLQALSADEVQKLLNKAATTHGAVSPDEPGEAKPAPDKADLDKPAVRKPANKPAETKPTATAKPAAEKPPFDADAPPAADPGLKYNAVKAGKSAGPFTVAELADGVEANWFAPETLVWAKGMKGWVKAETIPVLAALFVPPEPEQPPVPDEDEAPPPPAEEEAPPPPAPVAAPKATRKKMTV